MQSSSAAGLTKSLDASHSQSKALIFAQIPPTYLQQWPHLIPNSSTFSLTLLPAALCDPFLLSIPAALHHCRFLLALLFLLYSVATTTNSKL